MKKSLFALLIMASFALTFTGCKKDEEVAPTNSKNYFIIDGTKVDGDETLGTIFTKNICILTSKDKASTVTILFKDKPVASGSYSFKGIAQIKDLGANDLILSVSTNSKNYISNPGISEVVSITVTDGKISASIPKVTLSDDASNTITFEGRLLEY
jgi:hypothetical protein